uniref:Uncharacterized protein n=1 Tax=Romanomermis culicivorax TaxID=13658 RepID=A0A915I845_ROMCU
MKTKNKKEIHEKCDLLTFSFIKQYNKTISHYPSLTIDPNSSSVGLKPKNCITVANSSVVMQPSPLRSKILNACLYDFIVLASRLYLAACIKFCWPFGERRLLEWSPPRAIRSLRMVLSPLEASLRPAVADATVTRKSFVFLPLLSLTWSEKREMFSEEEAT